MIRTFLKLTSTVLALNTGVALAAERLTLEGAMTMARTQAREVTAAQARAGAARERFKQAKGFRLPSLALQEIWQRTDSPAEVFALTLNQKRFSLGSLMSGDPNNPDSLNTAISRVELQLPVYTGGELSGRIKQAELAADAANAQGAWTAEEAALAAAEAYVLLDRVQEYVGLLERARATVAAHVELARAYADQGMLVRSELLRAEVELARVEDMLAEAEGGVRVAQANLAFRVGATGEQEWELDPLPKPALPVGSLAEYQSTADQRPDLRAARLLLRAGELEESVRSSSFWPKVGLLGRSDWVDDRLFGGHGHANTVMAVASMNVFAGGSDRAAVAAARWEAKAGREDLARFAEGVRLEVRQVFEEAGTAQRRHETARKALAAAREAERITEERFRTGVVKMLDLLDASTARREAETRELVSRADACLAIVRLDVKSGRPVGVTRR